MFTVQFYTFSKKENSTKQPTGTATSYNCLLKDSCSVTQPVLELHDDGTPVGTGTTAWNPTGYNYVYIADFQRYYFVTDWEWVKPFWVCHLTVDVLASYKTLILSNTKYVLRSAADYDVNAFDDAYVPTNADTLVQNRAQLPHYTSTALQSYVVLGIAGRKGVNSESVNYYCFTSSALSEFYDYLYTNVIGMDWQSTSDWNAVISKAIVDPLDYIVSAYYVPLALERSNFPEISASSTVVNFGFWSYTLQGGTSWVNLADDRVITLDVDLTTPVYPYTENDGITGMRYERLQPFADYFVDLGAGGIHKLNGMLVLQYGGVHVRIKIDLGTGVAVYYVSPSQPAGAQDRSNLVLLETSAQFCPPVPVGRQKNDVLGMISAASNIISQPILGATKGGLLGAAVGAATGTLSAVIGTGAEALTSTAMAMSGSIGSKAAMSPYISLNAHYIKPQTQNSAEIGYVLCKHKLLSTLSGYTLCADGEITGNTDRMYDDEKRDVVRFLITGFYIE